MKNEKSKCNCAKNGGRCGRTLSLTKQGKSVSDIEKNNGVVCPLKNILTYSQ